MLNPQERIIVEAIKRSPAIEIRLLDKGDAYTVRVTRDKAFAHDVAIAVQSYLNRTAK